MRVNAGSEKSQEMSQEFEIPNSSKGWAVFEPRTNLKIQQGPYHPVPGLLPLFTRQSSCSENARAPLIHTRAVTGFFKKRGRSAAIH
jgi:hypothetical protein